MAVSLFQPLKPVVDCETTVHLMNIHDFSKRLLEVSYSLRYVSDLRRCVYVIADLLAASAVSIEAGLMEGCSRQTVENSCVLLSLRHTLKFLPQIQNNHTPTPLKSISY